MRRDTNRDMELLLELKQGEGRGTDKDMDMLGAMQEEGSQHTALEVHRTGRELSRVGLGKDTVQHLGVVRLMEVQHQVADKRQALLQLAEVQTSEAERQTQEQEQEQRSERYSEQMALWEALIALQPGGRVPA